MHEDDLAQMVVMQNGHVPLEKLRERFGQGKKCFGIKQKEKIVAFNWIDFKNINSILFSQSLKENEAYLFDMYTDKEFRGKNIAPYLRWQSYKALKGMGRDVFYSISTYVNTPSIKFKKKLNSKILWLGLYFKLFQRFKVNMILRRYKGNHI
jgi:hypothetical protein